MTATKCQAISKYKEVNGSAFQNSMRSISDEEEEEKTKTVYRQNVFEGMFDFERLINEIAQRFKSNTRDHF